MRPGEIGLTIGLIIGIYFGFVVGGVTVGDAARNVYSAATETPTTAILSLAISARA